MTGRRPASIPPAWFEALYARDPDPWSFATSDYERRKYEATLAALPRPRFANGLEVGCSIGVLTRQLAARCGVLLAIDVSETALARARAHCGGLDTVRFRRVQVPAEFPDGAFDLIVLSEVLYYFTPDDVRATARHVTRSVAPGAAVVLVHWLGPTDYPVSGDEAAELFIEATAPTLRPALARREAEYRLDVLSA